MYSLKRTEENLIRIEKEIQELRRFEREKTWEMIEKLAAILLSEDYVTGWVDARTLAGIAKQHQVGWIGGVVEADRMESVLRNMQKPDETLKIGDVEVDFTELARGKRTTPALKFTRVLADSKCRAEVASPPLETAEKA